jgi:hypothetical protein
VGVYAANVSAIERSTECCVDLQSNLLQVRTVTVSAAAAAVVCLPWLCLSTCPSRNRECVSSDAHLPKDVCVFSTFQEALSFLASAPVSDTIEDVYVIGGSRVYREALLSSQCGRVYLTHVHASPHCDTFFPMDVLKERFVRVSSQEMEMEVEENGHKFVFAIYDRQL